MLTGEYLVLKGAKALAIPLRFGQDLTINTIEGNSILWSSKVKGVEWFKAELNAVSLEVISSNNLEIADTLKHTLLFAKTINEDFLKNKNGYLIHAEIDFNIDWGLGSSSSFISNVAYWANCDPFELNRKIFKGSGYDIACARSKFPILYSTEGNLPVVKELEFNPPFSDNLYFVWLNQKQNTRNEIVRFNMDADHSSEIAELNKITGQIIHADNLNEFENLLQSHELIISRIIKTKPVQQLLFNDFTGTIKSLGAWGGDFVLVASKQCFAEVTNYFNQKGFSAVLKYNDMI